MPATRAASWRASQNGVTGGDCTSPNAGGFFEKGVQIRLCHAAEGNRDGRCFVGHWYNHWKQCNCSHRGRRGSCDGGVGLPVSSGTEDRTKVFSFLNTRSDFLTVAVVPN